MFFLDNNCNYPLNFSIDHQFGTPSPTVYYCENIICGPFTPSSLPPVITTTKTADLINSTKAAHSVNSTKTADSIKSTTNIQTTTNTNKLASIYTYPQDIGCNYVMLTDDIGIATPVPSCIVLNYTDSLGFDYYISTKLECNYTFDKIDQSIDPSENGDNSGSFNDTFHSYYCSSDYQDNDCGSHTAIIRIYAYGASMQYEIIVDECMNIEFNGTSVYAKVECDGDMGPLIYSLYTACVDGDLITFKTLDSVIPDARMEIDYDCGHKSKFNSGTDNSSEPRSLVIVIVIVIVLLVIGGVIGFSLYKRKKKTREQIDQLNYMMDENKGGEIKELEPGHEHHQPLQIEDDHDDMAKHLVPSAPMEIEPEDEDVEGEGEGYTIQ